ncbi:MAG TPA: metallophosphoesterase [Vicinamibacterales bacterium]|nr:metallophosphoesterase [Vicinamibacterales bacterium]
MFFGALGDIHGAFEAARAIVARHPEIPFWLCVGDIADELGRYESLGAPVYFIHGNNDNLDAIASGDLPADLHHIDNGRLFDIAWQDGPGVQVVGLGGTFAPTWYDTPSADLPHPKKGTAKATELADKRRHFVRQEVEACKALSGLGVDILLTHEAAKPFRPFPGGRGPDAGKAQINEILQSMQPRLHLFGHHHRFSDQVRDGVRSVGLDLAPRSYLLIEAVSFDITLKTL